MKTVFVPAVRKGPFPQLNRVYAANLQALSTSLSTVKPGKGAARRIIAEQPELVVVADGIRSLSRNQVRLVRARGIRTVLLLADDPYMFDITGRIAPVYDHVFTQEQACLSHYYRSGCRQVHYLPMAVDESVYYPRTVPARYRSDVCFVGNGFWNRVRFFDAVAPALTRLKVRIVGQLWKRLGTYDRYRKCIRSGWISESEAARYYNGAKIVVNLHRDQPERSNRQKLKAHSVNPRTFEISACGAFQLTDYRKGLAAHYTPGRELAVFRTPQEFLRKLEYYLARGDERKRMGEKALQRTIKEHTYRKRFERLMDIVNRQPLGKGGKV